MYVAVTIKLVTRFLADRRTAEGIRRFRRPKSLDGQIETDMTRINWALAEAVSALNMTEVSPDLIRFAHSYKLPTVELYNHRWRTTNKRTGQKQLKTEMFESFRPGAEITFPVLVASKHAPGEACDGRPPTIEELYQILDLVGKTLGLSPWGSKFGFGRFKVKSVKPVSG